MTRGETVLVTGVAGPWGRAVARRLLAGGERRVIGVDITPPDQPPDGLDVVIAAISHSRFAELLALEKVDTICHLAFETSHQPEESTFATNVTGTMRLAEAAEAAGVARIIVRSSTAVYGAHADNALYLAESTPLRADRRYGYLRDLLAIERFWADYARAQRPSVTILRLANPLGRPSLSPLSRLLQQPVAPVLLGFDPLIQVVAAADAFDAFVHAVTADVTGTFNIAAAGVLPLKKMLARAGVTVMPLLHPLAYRGARWLAGFREGQFLFPLPPDYLRYPYVADTTRMLNQLHFSPRFDGDKAVHRLKKLTA